MTSDQAKRDVQAPASSTVPDWTVLDPAALEPLHMVDVDGSIGLIAQVLDLYLIDSVERLHEAVSALAAGDQTTLQRAAHSLKTLGATVGNPALTVVARNLETAARQGDLAAAGPLLDQMRQGLPIANAAIASLRARTA